MTAFIIIMVILVLFGPAILMMFHDHKEAVERDNKAKKYIITETEKQEAKKMIQTEFFKKISKAIRQCNIKNVEYVYRYIKVSNYGVCGGPTSNKILFKELGYKDLTEHQQRILLIALSYMDGYKYEYNCDGCYVKMDEEYWKRIRLEKHINEQSKLKGIY